MAEPQNTVPVIGKDSLGREVKDLSVTPWWGVDRKEIEWHPSINYDKCIGCGLCFATCGRRVFDWDRDKKRPYVAQPNNCMVACTTCGTLCPQGAIEFPPRESIQKLVVEARVVKKAFDKTASLRTKEPLSEKEIETSPVK